MSHQLGLLRLSLFFLIFFHVTAQQQQMNDNAPSIDGIANFQPSLAVVIGILCLMFSLTFILLLYAKFCQRRASAHVDPENLPELVRSRSRRFSGIDKTVIESLPFFRFSALKGSKEGLECAVCLSKFEDIEILRLLPKCKHAFHIDCIDHWLERHSSCPLCRRKVSSDDPTMLTYSNSLRLLITNQSENNGEEPNIEIFVQREEERHGSSRFRIGSSFRKSVKGIIKEEELPIQEEETEHDGGGKLYHKHNHKITISDVVFKQRWSNVSSSDLMFLSSEMISSGQSKRFDLSEPNGEKIRASTSGENGQIINNIKEEMERKISIETKVSALNSVLDTSDCAGTSSSSSHTSKYVNPREKRSMSEITGVSRFGDLGMRRDRVLRDSLMIASDVKEERRRQLWLPIARKTVQWFVNRERSQPLNV